MSVLPGNGVSKIWPPPKKPRLQKRGWYCWRKKSQTTTWDVWNPINSGIYYLSTGAGFQPSTGTHTSFGNFPVSLRAEGFRWSTSSGLFPPALRSTTLGMETKGLKASSMLPRRSRMAFGGRFFGPGSFTTQGRKGLPKAQESNKFLARNIGFGSDFIGIFCVYFCSVCLDRLQDVVALRMLIVHAMQKLESANLILSAANRALVPTQSGIVARTTSTTVDSWWLNPAALEVGSLSQFFDHGFYTSQIVSLISEPSTVVGPLQFLTWNSNNG